MLLINGHQCLAGTTAAANLSFSLAGDFSMRWGCCGGLGTDELESLEPVEALKKIEKCLKDEVRRCEKWRAAEILKA